MIRRCSAGDFEVIYAIINAAAAAYKGVIPKDRWHEPYMSKEELLEEMAAGVVFWGYEEDGEAKLSQPPANLGSLALFLGDSRGKSTSEATVGRGIRRPCGDRQPTVVTRNVLDCCPIHWFWNNSTCILGNK